MARERDGQKRGQKGFLLLLLFFLFILLLAFFFGDRGFLEITRARGEIRTLQQEVSRLEGERDALAREVQTLRSDPDAVEKRAREKLWLMKKNEKVVVLTPPSQDKNK